MAEYRKHRPRFGSGITKIHLFYEGLAARTAEDDESWKVYADKMEKWCQAYPKSATPRIAFAGGMYEHAIVNSFLGFTMKRTKPSDEEAERRLVRSEELYAEAEKLNDQDPALYGGQILIAINRRWPPERVQELLVRSTCADPTYPSSFHNAVRYSFLHRDGGPPVDLDAWARVAVELTRKDSGGFVYGMMAASSVYYLSDDQVISPKMFSWPLVKRGYLDAEEHLPPSQVRNYRFCHLACLAGDRETAREVFLTLTNPRREEVDLIWTNRRYMEVRRACAAELSGRRASEPVLGRQAGSGRSGLAGGWQIAANGGPFAERAAVGYGRRQGAVPIPALSHVATSLAPSDDSRWAATGDYDHCVVLFNLEQGTANRLGNHEGTVNRVCFSPDGLTFASIGDDRAVMLWSIESGKRIAQWPAAHERRIRGLAFSSDGSQLITCGDDRRTKFWDIASGKVVAELPKESSNLSCVVVSPDGSRLVLESDQHMSLWKLPEREMLGVFEGPVKNINELAFSADGAKLACGAGRHGEILPSDVVVWDVATRRRLHTFHGHKAPVAGLAFSPDGKTLATGSEDMTIRMWNVP